MTSKPWRKRRRDEERNEADAAGYVIGDG